MSRVREAPAEDDPGPLAEVRAERPRTLGRWPAWILLGAICVLAFGVRALGFEWVFTGDGEVIFIVGDGQYVARRALYSFVNFPALLHWDPYINFPDGSTVPQPPLFTLLLAGVARLFGSDVAIFEKVLAWASPVFGALMPIPVYLAARCVADRGVALGAAAFVSLLPVLATASRVGDADHHAFIALLGATLLALCLAMAGSASTRRRLVGLGIALTVARLALVLVWSGSLLYVGLLDGAVLVLAVLGARRDLLAVEAASLCATALLLAPWVVWLPEAVGGPYSAISLSRLQPSAIFLAGVVAAGTWALERLRPTRTTWERVLRPIGVTVAAVALLLLFPAPREGLRLAVQFLGMTEESGVAVLELMPLFSLPGRPASQPAVLYFGHLAYLIPWVPVAALIAARDPSVRPPALVLAGVSGVLGALAIWQVRYGADFAAAGCIGFALALSQLSAAAVRLRVPRPLATLFALTAGVALLWVPITRIYLPRIASSRAALAGEPLAPDRALATPSGSLTRFLREVRERTPETSGFLDADGVPEYGVLCEPRIGHALHYVARRASPADGFLHVLNPERLLASRRFYAATREDDALRIAEELRTRYVVTMFFPGARRGTVGAWLHYQDGGSSPKGTRLAHFRLISEGPRGGRPLSDLLGTQRPAGVVPYKLYEIVAGAELEARTAPGTPLSAALALRTPMGRRFVYEARTVADADGVARVRVPYPTEGDAPVRAIDAYTVVIGERERRVRVTEAQVHEGAVIRVDRGDPL